MEKLLLDASQCKRAIRQSCESFVMVNMGRVSSHTDVSTGIANETFDNTCSCAVSADCSASTSAAGPDISCTLTQQPEGIKSQFADVFAETFGLPRQEAS